MIATKPNDLNWSALTIFVVFSVFIYLLAQLIVNAWVAEDAYITFRVLDNFVNGYGLRWNIHERVQAYTNPLWLFVHAPFYTLWSNIYLLTIFISLFFSIASAVMLARFASLKPYVFACVLLLLVSSKAWRDFTTSGLENPLSFFLAGCFLIRFFLYNLDKLNLFWLALLTGLAGFNRLDMLIIFFPVWAWILFAHTQLLRTSLTAVVAGFLPLVLWLGFSFFYYGFIFPNTKYAKLADSIPVFDSISQGLRYTANFLIYDWVGACIILAATFYAIMSDCKKSLLIILGVWLYFIYIIVIGGDYMSGRFFSVLVYVSIIVFSLHIKKPPLKYLCTAAVFAVLIANNPPAFAHHYWLSLDQDKKYPFSIKDERIFFKKHWLIDRRHYKIRTEIQSPWRSQGIRLSQRSNISAAIIKNIGIVGYYSGPSIIFIDRFSLSDALLARLTLKDVTKWRVGHNSRHIPEGYLHAVKTGDLSKMEPNIREYYQKLRYITTGDLWDSERMMTAINFNLGKYDHYRTAYLNQELKK